MAASFDSATWAPERREYGILHMLICRETLQEELDKPAPSNRLKAVDTKQCGSPILKPSRGYAGKETLPALDFEIEVYEDDDAASYISEGEPLESSEQINWGKSQRGAWWRVRGNLREDLVIRSGLSLSSAEVHRAAAGEVFQQKGLPRVITAGKSSGCIRMPIQPSGWVTADASRVGGPQYLIRTHAPQWRVVYQSPGNGAGGKDVIVREGIELDSEAVGNLACGDLVEQAGPVIRRPDGITRMQVNSKTINGTNGGHRVSGWVTSDASAAGGPEFFKLIPEVENGPNHNNKGRRRGQPTQSGN